ncbi:carotenoid biosynthesis protein [Polaromonas aquatica]|uniref:carotenoid biosynthesis protein n=1 Tax=Polaromonas aquatica TaxID=332657 RepID=UPI003D6528FE
MKTWFHLFEVFVFLVLLACLWHARKARCGGLATLFWGSVYGICLEIATIYQLSAYQYGQFVLMVFEVPLCIGIAWGCIIYSAQQVSGKLRLGLLSKCAFDGLFGLGIDLGLDVVAVRVGFWDWGRGLEHQYFGVPYGNFWAWFWVIFFFSLVQRTTGRAWLAIFGGLVGVLCTNALIKFGVPEPWRGAVVLATLSCAVVLLARQRAQVFAQPFDRFGVSISVAFQAVSLTIGLVSGVLFQNMWMLLLSLAIHAVLMLLLHHDRLSTRGRHARTAAAGVEAD